MQLTGAIGRMRDRRSRMQNGQPSRTALAAAVQRAAHQVLDGGSIFRDPLASVMLGGDAGALIEAVSADPHARSIMAWAVHLGNQYLMR